MHRAPCTILLYIYIGVIIIIIVCPVFVFVLHHHHDCITMNGAIREKGEGRVMIWFDKLTQHRLTASNCYTHKHKHRSVNLLPVHCWLIHTEMIDTNKRLRHTQTDRYHGQRDKWWRWYFSLSLSLMCCWSFIIFTHMHQALCLLIYYVVASLKLLMSQILFDRVIQRDIIALSMSSVNSFFLPLSLSLASFLCST